MHHRRLVIPDLERLSTLTGDLILALQQRSGVLISAEQAESILADLTGCKEDQLADHVGLMSAAIQHEAIDIIDYSMSELALEGVTEVIHARLLKQGGTDLETEYYAMLCWFTAAMTWQLTQRRLVAGGPRQLGKRRRYLALAELSALEHRIRSTRLFSSNNSLNLWDWSLDNDILANIPVRRSMMQSARQTMQRIQALAEEAVCPYGSLAREALAQLLTREVPEPMADDFLLSTEHLLVKILDRN